MTLVSSACTPLHSAQEDPPPPPSWLRTILSEARTEVESVSLPGCGLQAELTLAVGDQAALVSVRVPQARLLRSESFITASSAVYDLLSEQLEGWTPARFWNHIPCIHEPAGSEMDRYMAFNVGRQAGLQRWLGSGDGFTSRIATATGIGHRGDDLVVHGLGWRGTVAHVENPRQRPAYRYSRRFGPASPSFARATWLRGGVGGDVLAVGGTSSIRGEETVAPEDLAGQVEETVTNLEALVTGAGAAEPGSGLAALREIRVFHVRPEDADLLRERLRGVFAEGACLEFHRADICRRPLLIEIEGIAGQAPPGNRA